MDALAGGPPGDDFKQPRTNNDKKPRGRGGADRRPAGEEWQLFGIVSRLEKDRGIGFILAPTSSRPDGRTRETECFFRVHNVRGSEVNVGDAVTAVAVPATGGRSPWRALTVEKKDERREDVRWRCLDGYELVSDGPNQRLVRVPAAGAGGEPKRATNFSKGERQRIIAVFLAAREPTGKLKGIQVPAFLTKYKAMHGRGLFCQDYGYRTHLEMFAAMPDLVRLEPPYTPQMNAAGVTIHLVDSPANQLGRPADPRPPADAPAHVELSPEVRKQIIEVLDNYFADPMAAPPTIQQFPGLFEAFHKRPLETSSYNFYTAGGLLRAMGPPVVISDGRIMLGAPSSRGATRPQSPEPQGPPPGTMQRKRSGTVVSDGPIGLREIGLHDLTAFHTEVLGMDPVIGRRPLSRAVSMPRHLGAEQTPHTTGGELPPPPYNNDPIVPRQGGPLQLPLPIGHRSPSPGSSRSPSPVRDREKERALEGSPVIPPSNGLLMVSPSGDAVRRARAVSSSGSDLMHFEGGGGLVPGRDFRPLYVGPADQSLEYSIFQPRNKGAWSTNGACYSSEEHGWGMHSGSADVMEALRETESAAAAAAVGMARMRPEQPYALHITPEGRPELSHPSRTPRALSAPVSPAPSGGQSDETVHLVYNVLPAAVRTALAPHTRSGQVERIMLDVGQPVTVLFDSATGEVAEVLPVVVDQKDVDVVVASLGGFTRRNVTHIHNTLHTVAAMRGVDGNVTSLTFTLVRPVRGAAEMVRDLLLMCHMLLPQLANARGQRGSLLIVGKPGVGKTALIRDVSRVLSEARSHRVVVIDRDGLLAGGGSVPHVATGTPRRIVPMGPLDLAIDDALRHHSPGCLVVDEITTAEELRALARAMRRGVRVVAGVCADSIALLMDDFAIGEPLFGLSGGVRLRSPLFDICIEMRSRHVWDVHPNLTTSVDTILSSDLTMVQRRQAHLSGSSAPPRYTVTLTSSEEP